VARVESVFTALEMHGKNKFFNHHCFAEVTFCNSFQKTWGLNISCALNILTRVRLWNGVVTAVPVHAVMAHGSTYSSNLYNRWWEVVRFTPQPDCHRERLSFTNLIVGWVGPGAGLHNLEILGMWNWNKNITLTRLCPRYAGYIQFSVLYFSKIVLSP
jgi:hypothetical protein